MKRNQLYLLLGVEFAALLALVSLAAEMPGTFSTLFAFPFEQIGAALRTLSLTGRVGNALALSLWIGVSMLPWIPVCRHRKEKERLWENCALCVLSVLLLLTLYGMANPAVAYSVFPGISGGFLPMVKALMGCAVWSVLVLWGVLRLLRLFRAGDLNTLLGYLRTLLYVLCILFTGTIALSCGSTLVSGLENIQRGMDGLMAVLRFLAAALPYVLDIAVTLSAMTLLDALLSGDSTSVLHCTDALSRLCCVSLGLTTVSVAALNIIQLMLARWLSDITVSVTIPVMSIAFVLSALLLARLIAENRRLQADNDLFI